MESHLGKNLAFQIRAMRDREDWSQEELAQKLGTNQNAISRLENPFYGKPTITTLKRLAAVFDSALVVRFVPFSQLINWVSGTPFVDRGLSTESLAVPSFDAEEKTGISEELSAASPESFSVPSYDNNARLWSSEAPALNQIVANLPATFGELSPTFEEWPLYLQVAKQQTLVQPILTTTEYTNLGTWAYEWRAQPSVAVPLPNPMAIGITEALPKIIDVTPKQSSKITQLRAVA